MARVISLHPLRLDKEPQSVSMQRRARILHVTAGPTGRGLELHAECDHDDTTRAVDVRHSRQFVVLSAGDTAPAGSCYIGSCSHPKFSGAYHVYELAAVKPQGL